MMLGRQLPVALLFPTEFFLLSLDTCSIFPDGTPKRGRGPPKGDPSRNSGWLARSPSSAFSILVLGGLPY